jgi:hypothetical protein
MVRGEEGKMTDAAVWEAAMDPANVDRPRLLEGTEGHLMRKRNLNERSAMIKTQDGYLTVTLSDGPTLKVDPSGGTYLPKVKEFLSLAAPDVVFLDLNLPLSLGADLFWILRETSSGNRIVLRPLGNAPLQAIA